jgi:tetratricopeptide (TPR) repeat protein
MQSLTDAEKKIIYHPATFCKPGRSTLTKLNNYMRNLFFLISLLALSVVSVAQTSVPATSTPDPILYGIVTKETLTSAPFDKWYVANYDAYQPNAETIAAAKKLNTKDISIEIFFGTWCGDSRREVPRFMKLLDEISFPRQNIKIIGLGGRDSLYKQSPQKEDIGKGVYRVPVFIVYKNGVEINRINEFPVFSLEKDLYAILGNKTYLPNYRSFELIRSWISNGTLSDKNNNTRGLALQLKPLLAGENELNSLGYLLQRQGKIEEGLRIFQMNASLYPESANVISSLGEGYYKAGDNKSAVQYLERSLELTKDPLMIKETLKILYSAKGIKE